MQNQFSVNPKKRYRCQFDNCGKEFQYASKLQRHEESDNPRKMKTPSIDNIQFQPPVTPNNAVVNSEQLPAAVQSLIPIEPVVVNMGDIVFYENGDEFEVPDYSDEEEDEDETVDDNVKFTAVEPEVVSAEVEDQTSIVVNGEFFPFKDKIHQLMHQFYYRFGGDISQSLMKDIVKLVNYVTDAKIQYPGANVPAPDVLFNFDDKKRTKNQIPTLKQTIHKVKIYKTVNNQEVEETRSFQMNPPSEILKLLVANPSVTDHLTKLPDHTEGKLVESYQSSKWRTHEVFQHPMVSIERNGLVRDIWVGDLVKTSCYC